MAITAKDVIDSARYPINDDSKERCSDTQMLAFLINGLQILRNKRPDLFIGRYLTLPAVTAMQDELPLDPMFVPALTDYVTARAFTREDEETLQARAASFFALAGGEA